MSSDGGTYECPEKSILSCQKRCLDCWVIDDIRRQGGSYGECEYEDGGEEALASNSERLHWPGNVGRSLEGKKFVQLKNHCSEEGEWGTVFMLQTCEQSESSSPIWVIACALYEDEEESTSG